MQAVPGPYTVKMTSTAVGQKDRRYDCGTSGWFTMQIALHKHGLRLFVKDAELGFRLPARVASRDLKDTKS